MKRLFFVIGLLLLLSAVACSGSSEPIAVQKITLQRDDGAGKAGDTVTSFKAADHIFHVSVDLNRIDTGLKVKLVWVAVDTSQGKDVKVAETEFTALAANKVDGKVELPSDWPTGKYRLDVYLNDKVAKSQEFMVE
jgi:hypothetical protein